METSPARYSGSSRKLVVALDIGTTFSAAAYALLDPGEVPKIHHVTKYSKAQNLDSAKVSSTLRYDRDGNFFGVESGEDLQDDETFLRIKWWKLMLSPKDSPAAMKDQTSMQLPKGKTIVDVFADFMRYLFNSTMDLFKVTERNGELKWDSISSNIELVLSHPNGWGGPQQVQLRTAAVRAGIVPDSPAGRSRVHFVTEGETSFYFCAGHTEAGKNLKRGERVLIIDAGGGTIDISTYTVLNSRPLRIEELYEPKCLLEGGEFVTARAKAMVEEKLRGSELDTPEDLAAFVQKFDEGVKRVFSGDQEVQHVTFGSPRDTYPDFGIEAGRLTLTGVQVAEFFEPSVQSIVDSIKADFSKRFATNSLAFLVGGFSTSPWVSEQLAKRLRGIGLKICKPDTTTNKPVAVGAISFYVDRFVTRRISKFTYGAACSAPYHFFDLEHRRRKHLSFLDPAGQRCIPDYFKTMLPQGTKILEDQEVRYSFCYVTEGAPQQQAFQSVLQYIGTRRAPRWMDIEPDKLEILCSIRVDLSTAPYETNHRGSTTCYKRKFDMILFVDLTGLKAQIGWIDPATGVETRFEPQFRSFPFPTLKFLSRSDAIVVYNSPSEET